MDMLYVSSSTRNRMNTIIMYEVPMNLCSVLFLNQVCAGHRLICTWLLKIVSVWSSVCMCVRPEGY